MKMTAFWVGILLVSLSACVTTPGPQSPRKSPPPPAQAEPPVPVIVYYYVKPGADLALQDTLARAWALYQQNNMVLPQPHLIVKETERPEMGGQTRYIEIFTWVNHSKLSPPPPGVTNIWSEMSSLCVPHNGVQGPFGGELQVINPVAHPARP